MTRTAAALLGLACVVFGADTAWVRSYFGTSHACYNQTSDIGLDRSGCVYVCGTGERDAPPAPQMLLFKYSPSGELLWSTTVGEHGQAQALALDSAGNCYVAGYVARQFPFDEDIAIAKFSPDGAPLWDSAFISNWAYADFVTDVIVGARGDVYACGTERRDSLGIAASAFCVIRMDPASGRPLWTRSYLLSETVAVKTPQDFHPWYYDWLLEEENCATAMALVPGGNIVVTGLGSSRELDEEMWTMEFDPAGNRLWARACHSVYGQYPDAAYDLAVARTGETYLAGFCTDESGSENFAVARLDTAGVITAGWIMDWPALCDEGAYSIALDDSEPQNVYVTGYAEHPTLGDQVLTQKLSAELEPRWGEVGAVFGSWAADDCGYAVTVNDGRVYVAGADTSQVLLICYSSRNVLRGETLWTRHLVRSQIADDFGSAIAVSDSDHIYVAGDWARIGSGNCTGIVTARFRTSSGIEEEKPYAAGRFSVGPNPAPGFCLVDAPRAGTVSLYDAAGRQALSVDLARPGSARVDLRRVNPGVYLVRMTSGDFVSTRKLVVQR